VTLFAARRYGVRLRHKHNEQHDSDGGSPRHRDAEQPSIARHDSEIRRVSEVNENLGAADQCSSRKSVVGWNGFEKNVELSGNGPGNAWPEITMTRIPGSF
jgi:hypothetical protein